jgi:hypothetical protein
MRKKNIFLCFLATILNLTIYIISINALYLEYRCHEYREYAVKEDYLFGIFSKYPFLGDVLGRCILFSYSVIIITTIILIIKDFIVIKNKENQKNKNVIQKAICHCGGIKCLQILNVNGYSLAVPSS